MGSKSRIAKYIVPIIQEYIDNNDTDKYYEPFVGGANIIDKIKSSHRVGSDLNQYLIALLCHVRDGGGIYESVSKDLYDKARSSLKMGDTSEFEDWEIGNIGLLASYNGRWFDGGYAKPGWEKTKNGLRYRDYYREAHDNLLQQAPYLNGIIFKTCDYRVANPHKYVIYCDPPYNNTKSYKNSQNFDYDEFWNIMREWSTDNIVIVSEQYAPDDWTCIWEHEVNRSIKATDKRNAVERLYILRY